MPLVKSVTTNPQQQPPDAPSSADGFPEAPEIPDTVRALVSLYGSPETLEKVCRELRIDQKATGADMRALGKAFAAAGEAFGRIAERITRAARKGGDPA